MDVVENIRLNVRYLRKRAGYTQEQMAHELDMSPAYLRRIEKGTANPSLSKLEAIARFFMVNVPALIMPPRINLPVRYVLRRQVRKLPEVGLYPTYGICVVAMPDTETEAGVDFIAGRGWGPAGPVDFLNGRGGDGGFHRQGLLGDGGMGRRRGLNTNAARKTGRHFCAM